MEIGKKLSELFGNKNLSIYWIFVLGLVAYYLVSIIPIVGGIVIMLTYFTGIGAILIQRKRSYKMLREKNII